MDRLTEFLRAASERPFVLGESDCGRFCAAWARVVAGREPGLEFIGRYRTPLGLARILKSRGGIVAHFDACLSIVGYRRTETPQRGDIAIIEAYWGKTGAIVTGGFTAARGKNSVVLQRVEDAPIIAAWTI